MVLPPGCFMLERRIYFMLEWYVLTVRKNQIDKYNVLAGYEDELRKARRKKEIVDRESLKLWLLKEFRCRFWCRAEYEILVGDCWVKDLKGLIKIDVYNQLEINIDNITDYVIHKMNFKFGRNK